MLPLFVCAFNHHMLSRIIDIDMGMPADRRTGDIPPRELEQAINQRLEVLILTRFGEFPMEPLIGSDVAYSLFQPAKVSVDVAESVVLQVIEDWEPRIEVVSVEAQVETEHSMTITIRYRIIGDVTDATYQISLALQ